MWKYFVKGGFMMVPLVICSVIALAIIIERFFYFRKLGKLNRQLLVQLNEKFGSGAVKETIGVCEQFRTPLGYILKAGLEKLGHGKEAMQISIEEASVVHMSKLERYLPFLATIASVATLMGFTGTVVGMIKAFENIAREGISSPATVASGISIALITTATGLFIAIPTVIFYHYFNYLVDNEYRLIESYSRDITNINSNPQG